MLKRWILAMACVAFLAAAPGVRVWAAEENAAHNATASHEGGEHHELLPNLASSETWYSALWVLIIFCVLLAVLYQTAWKNVLAGLKSREERIRKDISDAEAAREKAETSLKEYQAQLASAEQKVREMISAASAEGERVATSIRMQAQQEAEAAKERAVKEIEGARRQAIQEIYAEAANLSVAVAEKILRRNLNADDQRELVNQSLAEMQTVGA